MAKTDKPFMVRRSKKTEEVKPAPEAQKEEKSNETVIDEQIPVETEKPAESLQNEPQKKEKPKKETSKSSEKEKKTASAKKETKTETKESDKPAKKNEKHKESIVANKTLINPDLIGDVDEEIAYELEKDEGKEEELYKKLVEYKESGQVIWGQVVGAEIEDRQNMVVMTVLWNGIRVLIAERAYFMPTWNFGEGYDKLSSEEKLQRRIRAARETIRAIIPVKIKEVIKQKTVVKNFEGEEEIVAFGSRLEAMESLRDVYFLHKNTDEPVNVNINDTAKAYIFFVNEDLAVVECLGVETRIDTYNLDENIVDNCMDFVKPGDVIRVRIKKININVTTGDVYLGVTGRLNLGSKAIGSIKKGGSYLGYVESYNKSKNIYTIKLKTKVNVSVHFKSVMAHVDLNVGDSVVVQVKAIKDTYVFGVAMKV